MYRNVAKLLRAGKIHSVCGFEPMRPSLTVLQGKEAIKYPGVGKATAAKIDEVLQTGHSHKFVSVHLSFLELKHTSFRLDDLNKAHVNPSIGLRRHQSLEEKDAPLISTGHGSVRNLPAKRHKQSSSTHRKSRKRDYDQSATDTESDQSSASDTGSESDSYYRGPKVRVVCVSWMPACERLFLYRWT